ncbi:MAG: hypothetical protein KC431_07990 [Myxococcales bacterium]|nr:hypothetical protein [Myxococcales bacterium]
MALAPTSRLIIDRGRDLRELPLTPQEFFLFSRVEALGGAESPTVGEVIGASGQAPDQAERALQRLIELGVLRLRAEQDGDAGQDPRRSGRADAETDELRDRARSRRRSLLEAQMRALRQTGVTETSGTGTRRSAAAASQTDAAAEAGPDGNTEGEAALPQSKSGDAKSGDGKSEGARSILERITPVAENDSRLMPELALPLDRQRRLLAVRDSLRRIGHFELLGLEPVDDEKSVRRAYHLVSREFHPDSFYGKDIGEFRTVLDDLFRRARGSYDFLMDPERRRTLVAAHEEQLRAEREQIEREELARKRAEQDELDRIAAEEAARLEAEAQAAREARAVRDKRRQQQMRDRALLHRRKLASEHAEQAHREIEAGRHGTAATLFRLAHEHDPQGGYENAWRETLAIARRRRAESSFARGRDLRLANRGREAAQAYADAADADPSLRNLSEAASANAEFDPVRARDYAMLALETLQQATSQGKQLEAQMVAGVHQSCARAFLAAGQLASAKEQAERAHALAPSKHTRTLLNSIKLA